MPYLQITRRDIDAAEEAYQKAAKPAARDPHLLPAVVRKHEGELVRTAEVLGAAFVTGVVKGKYGPVSVGPVPADAIVGLFMKGLGIYMGGSKWGEHLCGLGDGVLAGVAHTLGAGVGVGMSGPSRISGVLPARSGGSAPLSRAEIAAMAKAVR